MKNWKTTLAGLLTGSILLGADAIQHGATSLKTIAVSVGLGLLGLFASDAKAKTDAAGTEKQ